ncbi:hypothetical protein Q5752_006169 [Cryptotrichosporon argae]
MSTLATLSAASHALAGRPVETQLLPDMYDIANATSSVEADDWVLIVDVVILVGTIVGSLGILTSMFWLEYRGRAATTRMRIVQSLVISDLLLGIIGLIGSALELAGHSLRQDSTSCGGLGVMLVATLFSQHFWTLSLALATFMILIYPLHPLTSLLEKRWYALWLIVWAISFGVAVIGFEVYGYFPTGGICFYGTNAGIYGEVIQFVPRGIVFLCIAFLYGRLFVFLRRPDRIKASFSDSPTNSQTGTATRSGSFFRRPILARPFFHRKPTSTAAPARNKQSVFETPHHTAPGPVDLADPVSPRALPTLSMPDEAAPSRPRKWSRQTAAAAKDRDIPPWERVDLPEFMLDGQRFGGAAANAHAHAPRDAWADWRFPGAGASKKRPSTASSQHSTARPTSAGGSPTKPGRDVHGRLVRAPQLDSVHSTPDRDEAPWPSREQSPAPTPVPSVLAGRRRSAPLSASVSTRESASGSLPSTSTEGKAPGSAGAHSAAFSSAPTTPIVPVTPPADGADDDGNDHDVAIHVRRASAFTTASSRQSFASTAKLKPAPPHAIALLTDGRHLDLERGTATATDGEDDEDDDDEGEANIWDLIKELQRTQPAENPDDRFHVRSGSEQFEYVPESMASYLNRKTALLMLWFPLGYILLFSVSLIRIIYDFSGDPPASLRAISRWFIFAQGVLDALIYGLVEWHTKRVVRKRVRKGTFSPRGSGGGGGGSGLGSAMRGLASKKATRNGNANGASASASQQATANFASAGAVTSIGGPSVSFAEPPHDDVRSLQAVVERGRNDSLVVPAIR